MVMAGMPMFETRGTSANQRTGSMLPSHHQGLGRLPTPDYWALISKHSEKMVGMEWLATVETCHWNTV